ncbi:MAG: T9SS type A sorting domain-containing protein [Paludibacter sp.]
MFAISLNVSVFAINETRTVGNTGANYATLKAAFDAINAGTLTGNVTLRIIANTTETSTAVLNASGTGSSNFTTLSIFPTISGLSITGNLAAPIIDFDGADNVSIDGRVLAGGNVKSLVISNTSSSAVSGTSTVRFLNDAVSNSIQYCIIKGSATNATTGVLFLSTSTQSTGNDNNTISINDITASVDGNRPINAIYSEGSPNRENSNNTLANNNIYNFFNRSFVSCGVNIASYSTAFTISNNSFFETASFVPTANVNYTVINVNNLAGSAFQILNNYIGGSFELCSGAAWAKTNVANNAFTGIYTAVGTDAPSSIQGNKISNMLWENNTVGNWIGIMAQAGDINIGTTLANTIGESSGTSAIVYSLNTMGGFMCPIQINSNDDVNCNTNIIGSLTINNATRTIGIFKNSSSGSTTINSNLIGSNNTVNSIQVSANPIGSTQFLTAIQVQGFQSNTVDGNTISNLVANSTGTGFARGIEILSGTNTVSNNTIQRIKTASTNATSLCGLSFTNSSFDNLISGNSISDIENNNTLYNGSVIGMILQCSGTNVVSKNFIQEIIVSTATTNASVYGIRSETGTATYSNNIIRLGGNTQTTIYGMYESGSQTGNLYHNTFYIDGNPTVGARRSYALYSATNTNTIDYENNILVNVRSNNGATGNHYSAYFNYAAAGSLTLNYNVYFANGTGGFIGNFANTNISTLPIINLQDANSLKIDPGFLNAGGNGATDYKLVFTKLNGVAGTGVTDDFGGNIRSGAPTIGAWEFSGDNMWKGNISTDWGNALNWTLATIPATNSDIKFDPYPLNHLYLDINRTVNDISNDQATYRLNLNGKQLTVLGDFVFTNGAQLEASATGSQINFSGSALQTINSGNLYNNEAYNIRVNNFSNVILNGTLVLLNQLSSGGGRLDALTNSPYVIYRGVGLQNINISTYYQNRMFDLTIDNAVGVNLNSPMEISQNLTINSGKLLSLTAISRVIVNGQIVNNAGASGFILRSTASGTASLIHNTANVPATADRYIGGTSAAWHFLSSPISNAPLSGTWKPAGTYGDGSGYDLYAWDEPTNCWVYNLNNTVAPTWNSVHPSANFVSGKGYLYAVQALNTTKQFVGLLNNGAVTIDLTNDGTGVNKGFNFVGNPYPSSIDWKDDTGFTRSMLVSNAGGNDIWVWSNSANNYGVYNSADVLNTGTNGVTRYISPNMGFFVKAASNGTFAFNNNARVANEAGNWMRVKSNNAPLSLSLAVHSVDSLGSDEVKMTFESDNKMAGAAKMFSPVKTAPSLYFDQNEENFSTFYLTKVDETALMDVYFKAGKDGKYTLSANELKDAFQVVLLEDKLTGKIVDLKANENYRFTSKSTDKPARFTLYFTEEAKADYALNLAKVYVSNKGVNIDLKDVKGDFSIQIFDVNGSVISQFTAQGGEQRIVELPAKGMVFLKLYTNDKSKTFKLLN